MIKLGAIERKEESKAEKALVARQLIFTQGM